MKNCRMFRLRYLFGFILITLVLSGAYYLQISKGMSPCPLCLLQRMAMFALGAIFLIGILFKLKKSGHLFLGFLGLLACASGVLFSGRQVWLQISPSSSSGDCSASLSYIFNVLSIKEALMQVWQGGMECSQTGWQVLHLSLAAWSLLGFIILFLLFILQIRKVLID